jgi:hypothetical protein
LNANGGGAFSLVLPTLTSPAAEGGCQVQASDVARGH